MFVDVVLLTISISRKELDKQNQNIIVIFVIDLWTYE